MATDVCGYFFDDDADDIIYEGKMATTWLRVCMRVGFRRKHFVQDAADALQKGF